MAMVSEVPPGFHFTPTDQELISKYLLKKVNSQPLPTEMVVERDLYDPKSPWEVLNREDPWVEAAPGQMTKKCVYVFTSLKNLAKKSSGGKRIARAAGCGSWHGETGPKDVVDRVTQAVIGKKEMFTFESNVENVEGVKGHWTMHEYALAGSSLKGLPSSS